MDKMSKEAQRDLAELIKGQKLPPKEAISSNYKFDVNGDKKS